MAHFKVLSLLGLCLVLFCFSCKKDENETFAPEISLGNISSTTVVQFTDSIQIEIEYSDDDGDLGYENADSLSLWVHDQRLVNPDGYYVPLLAPVTANVPITGVMDFKLRNTFLLGEDIEEITTYSIRLKDRAGNWSNTLETPEITILP